MVAISSFLRLRIALIRAGVLRIKYAGKSFIANGNLHPERWEVSMKANVKDQGVDEIFSKVGPDATPMFDHSASNPTGRASSEATSAATAGDGEDEELDEEDDDAAELEEDDESNETEDVEDEAGV
jgi:hypothetical protein